MPNLFVRIKHFFNPHAKGDGDFLYRVERIIGYPPGHEEHFHTAFRHRSMGYVKAFKNKDSNERLEYLGDAILSAVVADYLFSAFPDADEGFLTQTRAKLVSRQMLNQLGKDLGLEPLITSMLNDKNPSKHILGNTLEALIGAIYLDGGYSRAKEFIETRIFRKFIDWNQLTKEVISYRSKIQEWAQKWKRQVEFKTIKEEGPQHQKEFTAVVLIDESEVARGVGFSKKAAKELAARLAFDYIAEHE
jgi:ribonuclease-3